MIDLVNPQPSDALVNAILAHWHLPPAPRQLLPLGGAYNANWRIITSAADVVVRVRSPWVMEARLQDVHALLSRLNGENCRTPNPRLAKSGSTYGQFNGRFVEVYDYMPEHGNRRWTTDRWHAAFAHLGRLHMLLNAVTAPQFTPPHVCNYADATEMQQALAQTRAIVKTSLATHNRREALAILDECGRILAGVADVFDAKLPRQLVHGDYHLDNLLFDEADTVIYTLDFDFVAWRPRLYEIAYALRHSLPQLTDNPSCTLDSERIRTWLFAYDQHSPHPLTNEERQRLPIALAHVLIFFVAHAHRTANPLDCVLDQSPYIELAVFLLAHPIALLDGQCI